MQPMRKTLSKNMSRTSAEFLIEHLAIAIDQRPKVMRARTQDGWSAYSPDALSAEHRMQSLPTIPPAAPKQISGHPLFQSTLPGTSAHANWARTRIHSCQLCVRESRIKQTIMLANGYYLIQIHCILFGYARKRQIKDL
ncbi:MAG: hypothetical protein WBP94_06895 [Rhodomicrobiaceae bacterium]